MTKGCEALFNRYMALKFQIQMLASIVKNDIEVTDEDIRFFTEQSDDFIAEVTTLKLDVRRFYRDKKEDNNANL